MDGLVMEEENQMEFEEASYLEMLGSGEEEGHLLCLPPSISSPPSGSYSSHMLCFGGHEEEVFPFHGVPQKSSDSSSMSSLSSSPTSTTFSSSKSSKKVESSGDRNKKLKTNSSSDRGTTKQVRKEKLGEQIMALHQLVSPFGKSDTASVLHEALGYIRFLHDQVQVLSSPYLQCLPSSAHLHEGIIGGEARTSDLRSRGLCLVPVSSTEHVANSNGADLWSPALAKNNFSSSSKKH
ncbi:transcription factor bHLH113-like isoform X3 [Typha angustifolia]|uniref:transcription factor bHLH113-like isoform X3 n=1 Tax=Typha angustifolia TaxID=59011 RepID=UPI003C2B2F1E